MGILVRLLLGCTLAIVLVFPVHAGSPDGAPSGVLNTTYLIEKQAVQLVNGRVEVQAVPGSAMKMTTVVFGKPTYGDLDSEGHDDAALFLVQDSGGSGTATLRGYSQDPPDDEDCDHRGARHSRVGYQRRDQGAHRHQM